MNNSLKGLIICIGFIFIFEVIEYLIKPKCKHEEKRLSITKKSISRIQSLMTSLVILSSSLFIFTGLMLWLSDKLAHYIQTETLFIEEPYWYNSFNKIIIVSFITAVISLIIVVVYSYGAKDSVRLKVAKLRRSLVTPVLALIIPTIIFIVFPHDLQGVDGVFKMNKIEGIRKDNLKNFNYIFKFKAYDSNKPKLIVCNDSVFRALAVIRSAGIVDSRWDEEIKIDGALISASNTVRPVDSTWGTIQVEKDIEASLKLVDTVFAKIGVSKDPCLTHFSTDSIKAYQSVIDGMLELNKYTETALNKAISIFDSARRMDPNFYSPLLYIIYCKNLQLDRLFTPNSVKHLACSDQFEWYLQYAERIDEEINRDINNIKKVICWDSFPLALKVEGDYFHLKGEREFIKCLKNKKEFRGREKQLQQDYLNTARKYLMRSKGIYISAAQKTSHFKLNFNLALTYFALYEIELRCNNSLLARQYLDSAEQTIKKAIAHFEPKYGPEVELAHIWFRKYRDFEKSNEKLLEKTELILNEIIDELSGLSLMDEEWQSQALLCRAAIELYKMNKTKVDSLRNKHFEKALDDLVKVEDKQHLNIGVYVFTDKDFESVALKLKEHRFKSIKDLYELTKNGRKREIALR